MKIILADLNSDIIDAWNEIDKKNTLATAYRGSIFEVECDAIVSPANSFGFMDGGIDMAISKYFGWHVQNDLQRSIKIKHNGELIVGNAEVVETGHTKIPYLIAAPTMRVPMILKDSVNIYLAIRAALLLIKYGKFDNHVDIREKIKVVAFPGMGTGVGKVPPKIFAKQMKAAIDVVNLKSKFPASWWEASERHQFLYSDEAKDLQFD